MNFFKKIGLLSLVAGIAFTACKKDGNKTPAGKIAGTWLVTDSIFYTPPNNSGILCSGTSDQISSFGIVIKETGENTVTVEGYKSGNVETASVTNTTLIFPQELGTAINVTGTISGNTIRFKYDTNSSYCFLNGRSTAVKQE